jgi:DNA methyltransferase 1-associated protein 1
MDAGDILGVRPPKGPSPAERVSLNLSKLTKNKSEKSLDKAGGGEGVRPSQSLPSLAPTFPLAKKRKLKRKAVPWEWRTFQSSARSDRIRLFHWVKATDDTPSDYPFARFNKKVNVISYTPEEYEKHLQSETWTKEQTDHLFDLCNRFDLRFPVIADRFEGDKSQEEMKERFYSVSKTIISARGGSGSVSGPPVSIALGAEVDLGNGARDVEVGLNESSAAAVEKSKSGDEASLTADTIKVAGNMIYILV